MQRAFTEYRFPFTESHSRGILFELLPQLYSNIHLDVN